MIYTKTTNLKKALFKDFVNIINFELPWEKSKFDYSFY